MRVILVKPGEVARIAEIGEELHDMQEIVGGTIQALYPWDDPVAVVCNDEGKITGLPLNRVLGDYDIIAGTFFICGIQDDTFCSLTEQQLQKYEQMFHSPEKFVRTPDGTTCIKLKNVEAPKNKTRKQPNYER